MKSPNLTTVVVPTFVDQVSGVERPRCSFCGEPMFSSAALKDILGMFGRPLYDHCQKLTRPKP